MVREDVLCLLLFMCILVNCGWCARHKDDTYDVYGLENKNFCHPLTRRQTTAIGDTAAIVKSKYKFDRWYVNTPAHCKFVFKTNKGDGLFGVIQKMSLRRNETQCIDYVRFKRKDNHPTEKFCGILDRSTVKYYPVPDPDNNIYPPGQLPLTSIYAEFDASSHKSGAELETEIFISKERLREGESLSLSIAYTPYKNCSTADPTQYKSIGYKTCIKNEYFCDGIYNCVPNVCVDESDCVITNELPSDGTGTKITMAAVTTMILCFVIFYMCVWVCKRSHRLCWSIDCASQNACSTRPGPLPRESEGSMNPPVQSAPMLEVAVSPSVMDKDLPPSYDSLFPEQSNPARS